MEQVDRPPEDPPGIVIVSGGASGLGAAVATAVAGTGAIPVVLDRREPADDVIFERIDLADTRAAEEVVRKVAARHGRLVAVVTCAALDVPSDFADLDGATWDRIVAVNLLGTAAVVRGALPHLERSRGRVVLVASTLGLRALPAATAYCASKFGVVGFGRALALELAGRVGVTLLIPGGMRTAFFDGRPEQYRPSPDQILNDPADVAAAVLFALRQPPNCEIRELVVTPSVEPSWP
ncbi:MAG: SDR family oxidoreductase [Actinomycetota bacterium]|nr:SDR family oxidoreductase [Actinomycetota bacterium]